MAKDIDIEINRLLGIKDTVISLQKDLLGNKNLKVISPYKFYELMNSDELDNDIIYIEVDPEIGQYIEGYIE